MSELILKFVVAGVIQVRPDVYLISKRGPGMSLPGAWCFPGGKVEDGETLAEALRREIMEEVRLQVVVGSLVHKQVVAYDHGAYLVHYFDCHAIDAGEVGDHWYSGDPNAEVTEMACVKPDRFKDYTLLEGDSIVASMIYYKHEIRRLRRDVAYMHQENAQMNTTLTRAQDQGTQAIQYARELERELGREPRAWPIILER